MYEYGLTTYTDEEEARLDLPPITPEQVADYEAEYKRLVALRKQAAAKKKAAKEETSAQRRDIPLDHTKSSGAAVRRIVKPKRAHSTGEDWVTRYLRGISSCGRFTASDETIIGEFKVPVGQYPDDVFGVRAEGDSMNRAELPDKKKGIKPGDIMLCRQVDRREAKIGDIVVVLRDGETCVKRLTKDGALVPESSNKKHHPILMNKDVKVQAVVIGKV